MKWFTAALLLLVACGGSETGNPLYDGDLNQAPPVAADLTASARILTATCARLTVCYPALTPAACSSGILTSSAIDIELGLDDGFGTYQFIIDQERTGQIKPDAAAVTSCLSEIGATTCGSSAMEDAYDPAAPGDFSSVNELIGAGTQSCVNVF